MATTKFVRPVFDNPTLNITVNPDGTVKRAPQPRSPTTSDPADQVLTRDVLLHPHNKTWLRLYLPKSATAKLPLIWYYHGGGFVFFNADATIFDDFCKGLAHNLNAIVISLDYRLAPENRLPTAYEDAVDGFRWLKNCEDEWIDKFADLNNCFLAGTSAGGNLAYFAGLRFAAMADELEPVKIRGLILHHPFFSGTKRTGSEERLADDWLLPLRAIDELFDLSLPEGTDHDHEYCNPMANGGEGVEEMRLLGMRVLVAVCSEDPLIDAGLDFAKMVKGKGVETVEYCREGYHGMEVFDPKAAGSLYDAVKDFVGGSDPVD